MIKFSVGIGSMGLCKFKKILDIGMYGPGPEADPREATIRLQQRSLMLVCLRMSSRALRICLYVSFATL